MAVEPFPGSSPQPPGGFGPVKPHLSPGGEDHEPGWRGAAETKGGGKVPRIDPKRTVSKVSLAEQFKARVAKGRDEETKGR